ncbi:MAG: TSUP family transporter [Moraxella sp.]|nr:TSUP family transporter [Moraxella sp.]
MDMVLSTEIVMTLVGVALVAGFIDAMAGGGGLLTIPALLLTGIPPVTALGTNKLQACAGSFSASLAMVKKGIAHPKTMIPALIFAFIGSALGTIAVQMMPPDTLTKILPFLIGGIGLYTLFMPNLGAVERVPRISDKAYQRLVVPVIGFYDGYFGPAVGTFFSLSNVVLRGADLVRATGMAKLCNFATNLASLIFFVLGGQVLWKVGLLMMAGQAIGAYFGSQMVVKGGAKFIRPVIVLMCFTMVAKLVWS